jgi:hypothetical protein
LELGKQRRDLVVPAGHPVRRLGQYGVYIFFDEDRCLYVGKASPSTLVGRALDYLYEPGGRPEVYRTIRENATRLLIRGVADGDAARRLELEQIVAQKPVLIEGFIYASPEERRRYRLGAVGLESIGHITGLKIHVEVWLAAVLLHEQGMATFSGARLAEEIERRFGDIRRGVQTHIHAHCVANAPKNTAVEYSYLFRTDAGEYRLFRTVDPLHPSRSGSRTAPDHTSGSAADGAPRTDQS